MRRVSAWCASVHSKYGTAPPAREMPCSPINPFFACQATKDLKAKEAENTELMGMCETLLAQQEAVAGDTQGSQDQV